MSVKESSLKLWHACKADSLRVLYHPLHQQLARGKIPSISFKKYIQQDFICLEKQIQIYDNAMQKLQPPQQLQQDLSHILQQQQRQLSLRQNYINLFEENDFKPSGENQYVQYLDELDRSSDSVIQILTSILPYQKLNTFVWSQTTHVYSDQDDSEFFRWLNSCDLAQYNDTILKMEDVLDELFKYSDQNLDYLEEIYQKVVQLYIQQINSYDCNQPKKIGFLAVDFDETLAQKETLDVLFDAVQFAKIESAIEHKENVEHKFQEEVNRLVKGYISAYSELISSLNLTKLQENNSNGAHSLNSKRLNEIISKFTKFERNMNQVVIDTGILSDVSKEQIQKQSRNIELQQNCVQVLNKYVNQKVSTVVISVNWSAVLICGALHALNVRPFVGDDYHGIDVENKGVINVFSNELDFDEQSGQSTGDIVRRIECSEDKGNLFQILNKIYNENDQFGTVFVGDSFGDIMAMLSADWGIIIGQNKQLRQVCGDVGIQIVPLLRAGFEQNEGVLYCVDGWEEIDAFLSWRVVEKFTTVQQVVS